MLKEYLNYIQEAKITEPHALLVIDVTNACCQEKYEKYGNKFGKVRKMVPRLVRFIDWYKKNTGGIVIYINIVKWIRKHLTHNINRLYDENPETEYYDDPDLPKEALDFYMVKPKSDDFVVTKNSYDAFTAPKLKSILKRHKIQDLLITGVYSTGCVNATINGAFSNGFSMIIMDDLVETFDDPENQKLQKSLKERNWHYMYGPVIKTNDFVKLTNKMSIGQIANLKKK